MKSPEQSADQKPFPSEGPHITPQRNFYRGEKGDRRIHDHIERVTREIMDTPEKQRATMERFFDMDFKKNPDIISPEEILDFKNFFEYTTRRIINQMLHKKGIENVEEAEAEIFDLENHYTDPRKNYDQVLFQHDIAHAIVTVENNNGQSGISPVPQFFRLHNNEEANNKSLIEEEARALIWVKLFGKKPLSTTLFSPTTQQEMFESMRTTFFHEYPEVVIRIRKSLEMYNNTPENFTSYLDTYLEIAYGAVEVTNTAAIKEQRLSWITEQDKKAAYFVITDSLKQNPDPRLVARLERIFNTRKNANNRILFDEFLLACGPLLKTLRNRHNQPLS